MLLQLVMANPYKITQNQALLHCRLYTKLSRSRSEICFHSPIDLYECGFHLFCDSTYGGSEGHIVLSALFVP